MRLLGPHLHRPAKRVSFESSIHESDVVMSEPSTSSSDHPKASSGDPKISSDPSLSPSVGSSGDSFQLDETTEVPTGMSSRASTGNQSGPINPIDETWQLDELLEQALERYLEAAPVQNPAQLRDFLPQESIGTQRFLLVELIKLDMASVSEDTQKSLREVEEYLEHFPDILQIADVPLDLVMEEIQLHKERGEQLQGASFQRRFPQHSDVIDELLGGEGAVRPEATAAAQDRKSPPECRVGQQVDDFIIIQTLGSGAFANVYLARQVSMSRLVALKVSRGTGDEPQALAQFDHQNIVRVYDQRAIDDPPTHLLYMQFLPGGTLAEVVQQVRVTSEKDRGGQMILEAVDRSLLKTAQVVPEHSKLREELEEMSWPMAVAWIGIHLSRALERAHRQGVMHRDVKPANVLLSAEGLPKLADFNVSFAGSAGRAGAASSFGGSIGYMAPEHLRAISATALAEKETVGPRADLYSLAILLWELWQGQRPFPVQGQPTSWTQAVTQQLDSRSDMGAVKCHSEDALSRLLEKILRDSLAFDPQDRVGSGAEMEARLILAMHPDAARLFDPEPHSWLGWLGERSPWVVTISTILVPNAIAGIYGFFYNKLDTLGGLKERLKGVPGRFEEIEGTFLNLATCINFIAFPLAVVLIYLYTLRVIQGLASTATGKTATEEDLFSATELPHRSAVIGGFLWGLAAVLYPGILWSLFPEFSRREVGHFFLSHVICGGVAAIYPFFGISIYSVSVLYPRMVRSSLIDRGFDRRVAKLVKRCERYLLLACLVPLMGATLLLVSDEAAKDVMLLAIAATGLGLFAAFSAYRYVLQQFRVLQPVLSSKKDTGVSV